MNTQTQAALNEIETAIAAGQKTLTPAMFSHFFGRGAASAAFRVAKERGLIEVAYIGGTGVPNYRAAGVGAAMIEAASQIKH